MGVAAPLQAFWEEGCCLLSPRMEEPETSDASSTGLTLNMQKIQTHEPIRMVLSGAAQSSSSLPLPACPGLGEGRVKLQQNKCCLKSRPRYPNAELPSASTLIHLSYLAWARAGHFSPSLMRSRAAHRRKLLLRARGSEGAVAVVSQLWGGPCGRRTEMWRGGMGHHGPGCAPGFPIPGSHSLGAPGTPRFCSIRTEALGLSLAHIKGGFSSAGAECALGTDL